MSEKVLRRCKKHGPMVHYRYVEKRGYVRWVCRRCSGESVLKRKQLIKRILVVENGGCCQACGYRRCIYNMHFHHVDPSRKEFALTTGNGKSLDRFRKEARKCVLVCANCHGEIEAGARDCPPTMADRVAAVNSMFARRPLTPEELVRRVRAGQSLTEV